MSIPVLNLPALPGDRHYRFHAMVKPTGARCNIDCDYCFYLHKTDLLHHDRHSQMNEATLEQHIRQYIEAQTGDEVVFSWQGGEPTLMGLAFFERIVELQRRHAKPGQRIANDLQTNGIALDDHWIEFLSRHGFHVGLSIDGPQALHDAYRKTRSGKSTFSQVMAAASRLKAANIPFAALCVVNRLNALHPREVYRFLVDEVGTWRVQFTPAVEPKLYRQQAPAQLAAAMLPTYDTAQAHPGHLQSIVTDWSVDPDDYGRFLIGVWEEWKDNDLGRVHVNLFETLIAQAAGFPAQTCTQSEFCGKALAVEHDGEVFSCDHFVYPEYRLGNLHHTHLGDMAFSTAQQQFGLAKRETLPKQCRRCDYLRLCWGECPKNRLLKSQDGEPGLNYLCAGLYRFYQHIGADVVQILQHLGYLKR
ncbi:anaerobic sulfatase maturase [Pseudaeromonas sharmana]|uniref:Anaerobic sulfatase maturase n=1 Tax=Pseudaeromonas sharmana TaxID=328412 RepID=A0ABV8CNY2_9GAMM